ncbi:GFA family protein [Acidimangrovimonas sediminis]|uniref:GFA family protein n=1 Tax=Acidimangrovimonas sediminis TaxID=2056283 RepID=UPI000C7FAEE8|nr:GFA family protein [Acidimangrovimonas sediminis]
MPDQDIHGGGCHCGAVRFEVTGSLPAFTACHCSQCRTWSGHYWAAAPVPHAAFRLTCGDGLAWHRSSNHARRGFCRDCGASLFWQDDAEAQIAVAGGAFDGPTSSRLTRHIFTDCAGDYYTPAAPPPLATPRSGRLTAGCLCGGVSFTLPGPARAVTACHCHQCRRLSGHFSASFDVDDAQLSYTARETLKSYRTAGGGERGFCGACGASLWFRARDGGFSVEAGCIRGATGGQLEEHIFTSEKGDYYEIADGLPQHPEW